MEIANETSIPNLHEYLYYGQYERTDEIDHRIASRFQSEVGLQPSFGIRSVQTRQQIFPIVPKVQPISPVVPIVPCPPYNLSKSFSPIVKDGGGGPFLYYSQKVNVESGLRNQYFALQHGSAQSTYVPSSNSDLYRVTVAKSSSTTGENPHPWLNGSMTQTQTFVTAPPKGVTGETQKAFNNSTNVKLR